MMLQAACPVQDILSNSIPKEYSERISVAQSYFYLHQSLPSAIFSLGEELSDKPLSMLSALRAMYDPRSVALKEYLPAMKDTVGSSGSLSM